VRKEKRFVENNIDQSDDERTRNNKDRSNGADADGVVFCSPLYLAHFVDRLGNVFFYNIHVKNESPMHFSKKTEKKQEKNGSLSKPVGYFLCMTHFQEGEMNSKERRRSFKICKITSRKVNGAERSLPFLKGGGGRDFLESI
jgi:hypothetical protein